MDFLSVCLKFCSSGSSSVTPGSYAYQTFKKVPKIQGFVDILKKIQDFGDGGGGQTNRKLISMGKMIQTAQQIISGKFKIDDFLRLQPQTSIKEKQSNLIKLIENEQTVIKKVKKSNYELLLAQHEKSGQKWTDPDFPPNQASIGSVPNIDSKLPWKRIPQILKDPQFVVGKIQPSDILQGSLGNCYFLSAIAALAENDFRIKNIFPSLEMNPYGIYMARIMFRGVIHEVVVDDFIPVNAKNQPLFAKPSGGKQIWVMILQKCWAKLNKNYAEIIGGLPNEVMHAFSGAPTFYRSVKKQSQKQRALWNQILQIEKKGGVICCGTKGDAAIQSLGLVKGHAYTILGVYEKPQRMLKIRNPWGSKEWSGKLSSKDTQFWSKLSPQQVLTLGHETANDGTFFMSWQDFLQYFVMIDICKINDNAHYINIDANFNKKNGQMFDFETQGGNLTLSLSQKSLRSQDNKRESQGYSRNTFVVGRLLQNGKYEYVNSASSRLFSDHYLELLNLPKGKYTVFGKFDWIFSEVQEATIAIYTDAKTIFKESKQESHPKFIHKVFEDKARKNPNKKSLSNDTALYSSQFLFSKGGYGYYFIEVSKQSPKSYKIQLNGSQFADKMLVLKRPHKNETVAFQIKPGESLIVVYRLKAVTYPPNVQVPTPKITMS